MVWLIPLHDDYKGLDVRGKAVLMLAAQQQQGQGRGGFGNQFARIDAAQKNGAVAVLVIGGNFPRSVKNKSKRQYVCKCIPESGSSQSIPGF